MAGLLVLAAPTAFFGGGAAWVFFLTSAVTFVLLSMLVVDAQLRWRKGQRWEPVLIGVVVGSGGLGLVLMLIAWVGSLLGLEGAP